MKTKKFLAIALVAGMTMGITAMPTFAADKENICIW